VLQISKRLPLDCFASLAMATSGRPYDDHIETLKKEGLL
jgi:hypothetical protein